MSNRIYLGECDSAISDLTQSNDAQNDPFNNELSFFTDYSSEISMPRANTMDGILFKSPQHMWSNFFCLQNVGLDAVASRSDSAVRRHKTTCPTGYVAIPIRLFDLPTLPPPCLVVRKGRLT